MNFSILPDDLPIPEDDGGCNHLLNKTISKISLPNQKGNLLKALQGEKIGTLVKFK